MKKIQIDMFEVQLGAALLLQFWTGNGVVRVLADAGVKASGYPHHTIRDRLKPILDDSGGRRIDLIIGTHYDEDHLNGLVPIIDDQSFEIGETWMPPVTNDAESLPLNMMISEANLLPLQFYEDRSEEVLAQYLREKRIEVETLLVLEGRREIDRSLTNISASVLEKRFSPVEQESFFRTQLAELISPGDCYHGNEQETDSSPELEAMVARARQINEAAIASDGLHSLTLDGQFALAESIRTNIPEVASAQARTLANMRLQASSEAINGKALHNVMRALRNRNLRPRCKIIGNGRPQRYVWKQSTRRFVESSQPGDGPEFMLLGPSEFLVNKLRNRLPPPLAARLALSTALPINGITPSNQLSYIGRFGFEDQGILVTGDAGCVDFKEDRRGADYYPALLDAMKNLHVIQVAHHAGANAHFYRVLKAAKYPEQQENSLLLLSHKENDDKRPNPVFSEFIRGVLDHGNDIKLLFTSKPRREKVEDCLAAFHPVVGPQRNVGDIRIAFENGSWKVKAHAVKV